MVILRALYPDVKFDETSLILFVIAILVLLVPKDFLERLQKLKIKDLIEIELQELKEKTEKAERAVEEQIERTAKERMLPEVWLGFLSPEMMEKMEKIIEIDPKIAIIVISMEIERSLREILEEYGVSERPLSVRKMAKILAEKQLIPREVEEALTYFWNLRNRVIHEVRFEIPDEELYSIIDLGLRLLKLLSLRRRK